MSRNDASLFEGNIGSWVEMLSTNVLGTCMMTRAVVQVGGWLVGVVHSGTQERNDQENPNQPAQPRARRWRGLNLWVSGALEP